MVEHTTDLVLLAAPAAAWCALVAITPTRLHRFGEGATDTDETIDLPPSYSFRDAVRVPHPSFLKGLGALPQKTFMRGAHTAAMKMDRRGASRRAPTRHPAIFTSVTLSRFASLSVPADDTDAGTLSEAKRDMSHSVPFAVVRLGVLRRGRVPLRASPNPA
jgi:hypothetical protein